MIANYRSLFVLLLAGISSIGLWFGAPARRESPDKHEPEVRIVDLLGDYPLELRAEPFRCNLPVSHDDLTQWLSLVTCPSQQDTTATKKGRMMHASRLWPFAPHLPTWLESDKIGRVRHIAIAADAFSPSWRGLDIAPREGGRKSEHRDQFLATQAEVGVPLDATIRIGADEFSVRDLLQTSINEFHLDQNELEWTAVAYALYLPPQSRWRNRFGEEYSFDALAEELLSRPLNSGSCQGIHLVSSLTTLLLCDRQVAVLTPAMRTRIVERIRRIVQSAVKTQQADGSWPLQWCPDNFIHPPGYFTPHATIDARVVVMGHLLEWFHWLPSDLKPPASTMEAGLVALSRDVAASPPELIAKDFCPYTHAIVALYLARSP